ncbi:MAG: hypothetical protein WBA73_15775 [Devosia sp.]
MIVNKSMFPLQAGFGVISKMQGRFAELQTQLGTGMQSSTLAGMGRDLPMSLSVRARLNKIEGFSANIDTVNLRLSFLDKTLARFDKIEGEARNSATQGQYGTNNINMATLPGLSHARLDELVTLLNSDVAGRYLFGGSSTDSAPLPETETLLEGQGGRAGYKFVVGERQAADSGVLGLGRLQTGVGAAPDTNTVTITEDGNHPFGMKLSTITSTAPTAAVGRSDVEPSAIPTLGNTATITFQPAPAEQIIPGQSITLGFTLPDGGETQVVMTAISPEDAPAATGQFIVGDDPDANAASFQAALDLKLKAVVKTEVAAASTFAAASNFFNSPGEPVLRVDGDPSTATALRVASPVDTVIWYEGQSPAIAAKGLGRLGIATNVDTVTLARKMPLSEDYGFKISQISASTAGITTTFDPLNPESTGVQFNTTPSVVAGETVEITLAEPPNGNTRTISLIAVTGKAGPGQFTIGASPAGTAKNFAASLELSVTEAAIAAEGNPRQSVTAKVDDSTRVSYGMQANESGFLGLMRTMAAMSVTTYPLGDDPELDKANRAKFDAMAERQQSALSEGHNSEHGSIEIVTMELGVARSTLQNSTERHTAYKAQLDNLLSDIETVNKEDVAMEILALQTRLQASYQATSMISKLSIVNFI